MKRKKQREKITLLLLMLITCAHLQAFALSPADTRVTIDAKQVAAETVIKQIQKQSGLNIVYTTALARTWPRITLQVKDLPAREALEQVATLIGCTCEVKGNIATLSSQVPMTRLSDTQENRNIIVGSVEDSQGQSLPGVTIRTDDPTIIGVSDEKGHFSIIIPNGKKVSRVTFSLLGLQSQTVDFTGRLLNVILQDETKQIDDVIVTGLFNYRSKSFTGSAQTYTSEELKNISNGNLLKSIATLDPAFMMEDNVLNGSNPNSFNDITIHGNASFSGLQGEYSGNPNEPLFIIDGFESTREQVFDLDMNRVKSVTILKDAAAKAIYGSKAANGVVVVETKEPETGRLRMTYTGDLNIESPDLSSYDLTNAAEKLQVELNAGRYTASSPYYQQLLREQYNEIQKNIAKGYDTDWLAQPVRTGVGQKHTLYIEGGDDRMRYSANVSYNGIEGVMKGSGRRTFSGNIKLQYRYKSLLFRNSLTITQNKADDSPYGTFSDYAKVNPYYSPYDENGNPQKVLGEYIAAGYGATPLVYYNPLYNASLGTKNFSKYTEYTENLYIEWHPLHDLRLTGRLGYTHQDNGREDFYPGDHTMFATWTGDNYFKRGQYSITDGEADKVSSDITANYDHQWGKHMLLVNLAWSLNSTNSNFHGMTAWGFINNHVDDISFAKQYAENGRPSGYDSKTRSIGWTGAVNYSYDDRYLADATLRYNGSSVFGRHNRWGTFWSVGFGWNIHNEAWMKRQNVINLLKLRGSYGLTGSQNFNPYQALATYKYYDNIIYDNIAGAYLMALNNPDLKWQQTADLNIGMDLQLFHRLNLRFDWYNSVTKDALLAMTVPSSTGFTSYEENLGEVENRGFDLNMNYRAWQNKGSFVSVFFGVSHNTNKVRKINDALKAFNDNQDSKETTSPIIRYAEGQSMTAIWAVKSLGIDPATGQELFLKKDGKTKTYVYSTDDYIIGGDTNPKYHGNMGVNGEYRGLGINAAFTYRIGEDYYNQTLVDRIENVDVAYNVDRRVFNDTWHQVGDMALYKKIGAYPSTTYPTTRFIQRQNVLDFSSLSAYYDFKYCDWIKALKMERLKISFYMNDVFHISTVRAERGLSYPYARSFSVSIAATF